MKFFNSLFFFCGIVLSQIFSVSALPISGNNTLEKRSRPFEFRYSFIYFKKPSDWADEVHAYVYSKEHKDDTWPGFKMDYKNGFYYLPIENYHFVKDYDFHVIFDDRNGHQVPAAMQEGFPVRMDAVYDETGILGITNKKLNGEVAECVDELEYSNIARIYYYPKDGEFDEKLYLHYKIGNGEWNSIPGDEMAGFPGIYYSIDIDLHDAEDITYAFTDGKKWDNNDGNNYYHHKHDNFVLNKGGRRYEPY